MNIVVLSHRVPYPPIKGEKIRTYHQLESLRAAGCNISVFCPLHEPEDAALAHGYADQSGFDVFTAEAGSGWGRMVAALFRGRSLSVAKFHLRALQEKLNNYLSDHSVDLLYCTSSAMAEYAFLAGRIHPKLRVIVDFMDLDSDKWWNFSQLSRFPMSVVYGYESKVLGRYEQRVQQSVDECLFVSQAEADLFCTRHQYQAKNLRVVGNGVELSNYYPPAEPRFHEPLTLLFTGVMDYLPNEDAICWFADKVWPMVVQQHPAAKLVVAGMKPSQRVLDLQQLGNIEVTGFVEEMLPYYQQADVFIAPFQIARGVQNKILQAFACGLPVVTTPIGAEGIDGNNEEHVLIAETPQHFAEQIQRLVQHSDLYQRLSVAARELIQREYLWEAKNRHLIELVFSGAPE